MLAVRNGPFARTAFARRDLASPLALVRSTFFASTVFASVALLSAAMPAWAGHPAVHVTVTQNPAPSAAGDPVPAVTYSRPAPDNSQSMITYVAYDVRISNDGPNAVNSVSFSAVTSVTNAQAAFVQSIGITCQRTMSGQKPAISCPIGTLRGRGDFRQFTVVYQVPDAGTPARPTGDHLNFTWTAVYGDGTRDDSYHSSHTDTDTQVGTVSTKLDATVPDQLQSFVPTTGATLFTGNFATATANDTSTTRVVVPGNLNFTTSVRILETVELNPFSAFVTTINTTKITIPGQFAQLEITLRRDASTINNVYPNIGNIAYAKVLYSHLDDANYVELAACPANGIPTDETIPCIFKRTAYTTETAPNPDYVGDWEFVIHALKNGSFKD